MPKTTRGRATRVSTRTTGRSNRQTVETNLRSAEVNSPDMRLRSGTMNAPLLNREQFSNAAELLRDSGRHEETSMPANSGNPMNLYSAQASTSREIPDLQIAAVHTGREGSVLTGATSTSGLFSVPLSEPENPIPFKAALEFIPKSFDGYNLPVSRFINDCIYARNSIAARDRQYLFLMVRTRIAGRAYATLQDRDIHSLEDLLRHLKITFTETRNLSQLNTMLANVAQRESEKVLDFGTRVGEILTNIIELVEETNSEDYARALIKSARDTALDNFIMGLKRELAVRVRGGHPNTLQEAINLARTAEWEIARESTLDRKDLERFSSENMLKETRKKFENQNRTQNRFRPYHTDAKIRQFSGGKFNSFNNRGGNRGRVNKNFNSRILATNRVCEGCGEEVIGCLRMTGNEQIICHACRKPGHIVRECPNLKADRPICYNCQKPGHLARNCTAKRNDGKDKTECNYCKKSGHTYDECRKRLKKEEESRAAKEINLNE